MSASFRSAAGPVLLVVSMTTAPAVAATFTVDNLDDAGPGTLRQAIADANGATGPDEIIFSPGLSGTVELVSGLPAIQESLTVSGPGAGVLTVDANGHSRVLTLSAPSSSASTISGLTLKGGMSGSDGGGGIFVGSDQLLTLEGVHLVDNVAADGAQQRDGGGLATATGASVTVRKSLIARNHARRGGGVFVAGAVVSVEQSAIVSNRARLEGGGVWIGAGGGQITETTLTGNVANAGGSPVAFGGGVTVSNAGALTLYQVSLVANFADSGPGLQLFGSGVISDIGGTIIAGNRFNGTGNEGNCSTGLGVTDRYNLSGDASCGFTGTSDIESTDPGLQGLAWAGGPTPSLVPMVGGAVVDSGTSLICISVDQRDWPRPVDGDASGAAVCDLGAVEMDPSAETLILARDFEWSAPLSRWSASVGN